MESANFFCKVYIIQSAFWKKCTAACIVGAAAADVLYILFLLGTLAIKNTDLFDEYHASTNVCS